MEPIFTGIYESSLWGNNDNKAYSGSSGDGSNIEYNIDSYIPFIKKLIVDNNFKQIVDLGCGDFKCGKLIYDTLDVQYTGYDTYKKIADYNASKYIQPKYTFIHSDFYTNRNNIKSGDLCIIKDVLQHWSLNAIYTFLDYITEKKII